MRRMDHANPGIDEFYRDASLSLFIDVIIISPLHDDGSPMPHSAGHDGAAVLRTEKHNREIDYPDVQISPHALLLSLDCETYGRWSDQALGLIR